MDIQNKRIIVHRMILQGISFSHIMATCPLIFSMSQVIPMIQNGPDVSRIVITLICFIISTFGFIHGYQMYKMFGLSADDKFIEYMYEKLNDK